MDITELDIEFQKLDMKIEYKIESDAKHINI